MTPKSSNDSDLVTYLASTEPKPQAASLKHCRTHCSALANTVLFPKLYITFIYSDEDVEERLECSLSFHTVDPGNRTQVPGSEHTDP